VPDDDDAEVDAQQAREATAVTAILARLAGLDEVPRINDGSDTVPLPGLAESIDVLTNAQYLPGPQRLELLARVASAKFQRPEFSETEVDRLAASVTHESLTDQSDEVSERLTHQLASWRADIGNEPLERNTLDALENPPADHISRMLREDIQCTALKIRPACGADPESVGGVQALSIVTDMYTCKKFDEFESLIDPFEWPKCWLQSSFFRSMTPEAPPPKASTPSPDLKGWKQTVLEICDFGLGFVGGQRLETSLDFVYFWNEPLAVVGAAPLGAPGGALWPPSLLYTPRSVTRSPAGVAGCTYDLKQSIDSRILVDQGFLLVEDVPDKDFRRYRTQKEIRFSMGNPPRDIVCPVWSAAVGLIVQGC
jgi:hypothetical protein